MNIYIGNLSYEVGEQDLRDAFGAFGRVTSAKVIADMYTGKSKGFGFVEMESSDDAQNAISSLNGSDLKGRNITVNEARPRNDAGGGRRDGGNGGGRRNGGGFGGGGGGGQRRGNW